MSYIDELLTKVRDSFVENFSPFCRQLIKITTEGQLNMVMTEKDREEFKAGVLDWDKGFSKMLRELERNAASNRRKISSGGGRDPLMEVRSSDREISVPSDENGKEDGEENASKNLEALKARLGTPTKKGKKKGKVHNKDEDSRPTTPGSGADTPTSITGKKKGAGKEMRRWDGGAPATSGGVLDFSTGNATEKDQDSKAIEKDWVNQDSLGTTTGDGVYEIRDVGDRGSEDEEEDEDEEEGETTTNGNGKASKGWLSSFTSTSDSNSTSSSSIFSRLTSSRSLTSTDLAPTLLAMSTHLQSKNVASDVATRVCSSVERSLLGKKMGSFGSVKKEVREAMEEAVTRILTPRTSTDILLEIRTKRSESNNTSFMNNNQSSEPDPYSITFVGVNGVGKSTNLAKVAFWLLQNKFRVLIAACDTFRSGAVEQLNVHVRNLSQLDVVKNMKTLNEEGNENPVSGNRIELFQKGYGKDAAGIAASALKYGKTEGFDVVLIDTAGRMQDNEPLMRSLSKLVSVNNPDKIVFVGEALVGNEAVDQLTKFDKSLKDFSGVAKPRGLDGMLLTKFDTSE